MRGRGSARSSARPWEAPPRTLVLPDGEVHVWRAALDDTKSQARDFEQILSNEERDRAARFSSARDREHFTVARAMLRLIVGKYLSIEPRQLQLTRGPHGKPALATERGANALRFNSSRSGELALCAIARGRDVGVDVEHVRADLDLDVDQIAERFFSPRELATFRVLPPERKQQAFFTCWVRKEAYLKATGDGLAIPLESFSVSFSEGDPAALLDVPGHPEHPSEYSLWELDPGPSYVAALAAETGIGCVTCWQFTEPL